MKNLTLAIIAITVVLSLATVVVANSNGYFHQHMYDNTGDMHDHMHSMMHESGEDHDAMYEACEKMMEEYLE